MKLKDASLLRNQSYIDGEWVGAADGRSFAVHNPADGSLIAEVADLGAADVTRAIGVAVPAQKAWAHAFCAGTATPMARVTSAAPKSATSAINEPSAGL